MRLSARLVPWFAAATLLLLAAGTYLALFASPPDYQQGESVRIMYVHGARRVDGPVLLHQHGGSLGGGTDLAPSGRSAGAKATAPIGACFTLLALLTGSLWGKPMWGTWWVWDARLTSVLVLLFLYLGYMALESAFDDPARGTRAASILALMGFVNVPIIKFSVDWWNTLHQPASVVRLDGPAIYPSMLAPLLIMAAAFTSYYFWVVLLRVRGEIVAGKIRGLRLRQAHG